MKRWLWLALVMGCSTVQWDKPGASAESIDADLRRCNALAQAAPGIPAPRTTSNSVEVRASPAGGVSVQSGGTYADADSQLQKSKRVEDCMRQRGYTLKPA